MTCSTIFEINDDPWDLKGMFTKLIDAYLTSRLMWRYSRGHIAKLYQLEISLENYYVSALQDNV